MLARFTAADQVLAKWLGPNAINPLAVDGKGGKGELLGRVERWVAASGRNITQPGSWSRLDLHLRWLILLNFQS